LGSTIALINTPNSITHTLVFNHSFIIVNSNWASLQLQSAAVFASLWPTTSNRTGEPLWHSCYAGLPIGSIYTPSDLVWVSMHSQMTYSINASMLLTREFEVCLYLLCASSGSYRISLNSIARVSYLGLEMDLSINSTSVDTQCNLSMNVPQELYKSILFDLVT